MKISDYKKADKSSTIDLSDEVQDTNETGEAGAGEQQIQDTSTEIQETGQFDNNEESTETQNIQDDAAQQAAASTENEDPNRSEASTESVDLPEDTEVEISEEQILKSLSEKLGREVTSFDDLNKTEDPYKGDEYLKGLAEWREKTNRPIEDWIKFQKDYTKVSDVEVAREYLQLEFPELSPEDIDLELNSKFISTEDDMDNDAALKNLELKKYAFKGRKELGKLVSDLGEPSELKLSPEMKQDLEIAKNYKSKMASIAEDNKAYETAISSKASEIQSISMDLADGVALDFKLPAGSNKDLVKMVQEAPHWKNEDGTMNHEAVVRDAAIIANYKTMIKLAFEQGKNSGTDETIREAKNSTLGNRTQSNAAMPNEGKGVEIEGLEKYLGKTGMRIRKRN